MKTGTENKINQCMERRFYQISKETIILARVTYEV